jgi:hypothetical protein
MAAVVLAGSSVAFSCRYLQTIGNPIPTPPFVVPPMGDHLREALVSSLAQRITGQVLKHREEHGQLPPVADFWKSLGSTPLYNPINGTDEVVALSPDRDWDTSKVGRVYDQRSGIIYPGAVYNASRSPMTWATSPTVSR